MTWTPTIKFPQAGWLGQRINVWLAKRKVASKLKLLKAKYAKS